MAQNHPPEPDLFGGVGFVPTVAAPIPRTRTLSKPLASEEKKDDAFKTISETADMLDLPQHVLRFWESKFTQIKPLKLRGGRRYYRPQDIDILLTIKHLLYKEGYTIKGARRAITQARKQREPLMVDEKAETKSRKKSSPPVHDTPLFASLAPEPAEAAPAAEPANPLAEKKQELRTIHNELLELRKLISGLPTLPTHA